MHKSSMSTQLSRSLSVFLASLILFTFCATTPAQQPRTPTETVREFYKALREKRFRDAFALSIYKPAIDGLTQAEMQDLQPDFEKLAANIPENIQFSGEQMSGDIATVFVKVASDASAQPEPVALLRVGNVWIVGDRENQEIVKKSGKDFFFKARIETHHNEAQAMLQRIAIAQLAYSQQHGGLYADLPTLISAGLIPKDIEGTDSTGYIFHVNTVNNAKSYTVSAEPAKYGRTGKLSFFMDQTGIRSGDVGGKPLILPGQKP